MPADRVDDNQQGIINALRDCYVTVQSLTKVKGGCPDILVGYEGRNWVFEIKNPNARGKPNKLQREWHRQWAGQVGVVWTVDDVLRAIGLREVESC